jgi:hypothetical protein
MQNPRLHCKIFLHLIPEPEEKASEPLRDLIANDKRAGDRGLEIDLEGGSGLRASNNPPSAFHLEGGCPLPRLGESPEGAYGTLTVHTIHICIKLFAFLYQANRS